MELRDNIGNIVSVVGLIITITGTGWIGSNLDALIGDSVARELNRHDSRAFKSLDSVMTASAPEVLSQTAELLSVHEMFKALAGEDSTKMINYYKKNFQFADTMRAVLDGINPRSIRTNHQFINTMIKQKKMVKGLTECDKILRNNDNGRPVMYVPCEGQPMAIMYGRPNRSDGMSYKYEVYFVKKNGADYVLNRISDVLLE